MRSPTRRSGRGIAWVTLRKVVQTLALLLFIGLFILARKEGFPTGWANLPFHLDPLTMIVQTIATRTIATGMVLALVTLLLTIVFGRAWCGWLCPLGTVLDIFSLRRWRNKSTIPVESWRRVKYILLLVLLIGAVFGNSSLLVTDPITILGRTISVSLWPALNHGLTMIEGALYRIPVLREGVSTLDRLLRPAILPLTPISHQGAVWFAVIFVGLVLANLVAERFWCRYLCPLGGLLGMISKGAIIRRQVGSDCKNCDRCVGVCPTGTITAREGYPSDPSECTVCLECVDDCPLSLTTFSGQLGLAAWRPYDPSRREFLLSAGLSFGGLLLFRLDRLRRQDQPGLIRPPGTDEEELLTKCIRCGECMHVCPTGAIQPAWTETGFEGLWTPILQLRVGYCDYGCNSCGQSCPVEAIPPLRLEEKRVQIIGVAQIDQDRCIPWAEEGACIVCEEMCPLPEKAITLEPLETVDPFETTILLQRPKVLEDQCIGCGICEYKCPVEGEAAIQIVSPGSDYEPSMRWIEDYF